MVGDEICNEDSISTLRYVTRALSIPVSVTPNMKPDADQLTEKYEKIITQLKAEIALFASTTTKSSFQPTQKGEIYTQMLAFLRGHVKDIKVSSGSK